MKKNVLIGVVITFLIILFIALIFVIALINKNKTGDGNSMKIGDSELLSEEELNYILNSDDDIFLGDTKEVEEDPDAYDLSEEEMAQKMEVVEDFDTYWQISNYLKNYYSYYNDAVTNDSEESRSKEILFDLLGEEFKTEKGIEDELNFGDFAKAKESFYMRKIMSCSVGDNGTFYIVEGIKTEPGSDTNYKIGILEDNYTEHYCIYPNEFIQKHFADVKEGSTIDFEFKEIPEIMATEYGEYEVDDYEVLEDILGTYRACIQYDVEYAYNNYLLEDYKNNKFPNLDDYKNYLRYNKDDELGFEISSGNKDIEYKGSKEITTYHLHLNNGKSLDIENTGALDFKIAFVD